MVRRTDLTTSADRASTNDSSEPHARVATTYDLTRTVTCAKVSQDHERGVVTLPKELRTRYGLGDDAVLTLVDFDGVFVLSPRVPVVTELARQLAEERLAAGLSVDDLIADWSYDRHDSRNP